MDMSIAPLTVKVIRQSGEEMITCPPLYDLYNRVPRSLNLAQKRKKTCQITATLYLEAFSRNPQPYKEYVVALRRIAGSCRGKQNLFRPQFTNEILNAILNIVSNKYIFEEKP
ncbi:hypothetical protein ['Paenibacillus yunnanensis' Narsing Rao et al. 2020]|uniref:hypothetical protein n=1 Tax=Paenibacillus tengchongensis TaxID=2608684 RepID=UPI001651DD48|nr:hypothetical protein [Paenibacillus tengchongensis]